MSNALVSFDPKVIQSLPLSVLATLPAANPPLGILPEFANPTSHVPVILGVSSTFLILAIFCFFIRIYTKLFITKKWRWDDFTCGLGFVLSIVDFAFVVVGCVDGAIGKHIWDLYLDTVLNKRTLISSYIATVLVNPGLGLIKLSFFIQLHFLFRTIRSVRILVYVGGTICAATYIVATVTAFALCSPWPGETWRGDVLSWHYLKYAAVFPIPIGAIGILLDFLLLLLPMPIVWSVQLSLYIGIMLVFMTGSLSAVASVVGLYYRIKLNHGHSDTTWKIGDVILWAQIEMFCGVAASSMPTVKQFFTSRPCPALPQGVSSKSCFARLLGTFPRSVKDKLHGDVADLENACEQPPINTHRSDDCEEIAMNKLDTRRCKQSIPPSMSEDRSRILVTQDICVTWSVMEDESSVEEGHTC